MKKKVFGFTLIVILISIAVVNLIQDAKAKKADELAQEEFLKLAEDENDGVVIQDEGLGIGDAPPDFELQTLDGNTVRLSDYKGKKVILNFWASWCPPCKAEMPHMEHYYETQAESDHVEILAVNLTDAERGRNVQKKVTQFVNDFGLTFPIPLDVDGKVGRDYQIFTIPTSFIIDRNGLIQKKHIGPMNEEMISSFIKNTD